MMKILFASPLGLERNADYLSENQMGAVEQQIFGLSKELVSRGHEVYILRKWSGREGVENVNNILLVNINLHCLAQKNFMDYFSPPQATLSLVNNSMYFIKVLKRIKIIGPDVVNMSAILQGFFISRAHARAKVFITHNNDIFFRNTPFSIPKQFMLKSIARHSNAVVALTKSIKHYLESYGFKVNAVIPNALNLSSYKNKGEEKFILYAGRLVEHKMVEDLLETFYRVRSEINENLIIIGEGPRRDYLFRYATRRGIQERVSFLPFLPRTEYRNILSRCSVFVMPSNAEAFCVVIIEAMASGKPVIARSIPGPADIITHGHNGFLFNTNDELKGYLKLLLSDSSLRRRIGDNARKTVEQRYTFDRIADSYESLYESLIS